MGTNSNSDVEGEGARVAWELVSEKETSDLGDRNGLDERVEFSGWARR